MNFKEIKELLMLIDNTKLEYVKLNTSVVENKENNIEKVSATNNSTNEENNIINTNDTLEDELAKEDVVEFAGENLKEVKAPLIGTFYESPDPDSPAFVSVGDHVEKGDTLCIVEAMKLMNEIKSEFTGKVVEIKATNESMVEYGQTLFVIEED